MPIAFDLSKLTIDGFRGIAELEIDLPRRAPLALIGGNNCGKSTILDSIAFALEGARFYSYEVDEFDFYRDCVGPARDQFTIEIDFAAERPEYLPAVRGIENPIPLYGSRAVGRRYKKGGTLESRVELFGKDRQAATYSTRTPLRGAAKEKWSDHDINYRKFTARSTDAGGAATPLRCMGHGWQSLVRMASLDVLSQIPDQVLLVEEPETYLHPHLARRFRRVLNSLAAQGWVVVLSTHSPSLFRVDGDEVVVRLRREGNCVSAGTVKATDASDLFRVQAKLDERGTHEFLFSQSAVLCEGKDDVCAVKLYLSKMNADLDILGREAIVRSCDGCCRDTSVRAFPRAGSGSRCGAAESRRAERCD
jgi:ABC-type cobalamin/Fe3+-siderophores transport system ATPase subunit